MGIIIGMLFSVAFPEVAQTVNDAIMPTIQSISEQMINWITEQIIFYLWTKTLTFSGNNTQRQVYYPPLTWSNQYLEGYLAEAKEGINIKNNILCKSCLEKT